MSNSFKQSCFFGKNLDCLTSFNLSFGFEEVEEMILNDLFLFGMRYI